MSVFSQFTAQGLSVYQRGAGLASAVSMVAEYVARTPHFLTLKHGKAETLGTDAGMCYASHGLPPTTYFLEAIVHKDLQHSLAKS